MYCFAALMSVDERLRDAGCVGSWRDGAVIPVSVANEKSRWRIAWSERGPEPNGRMPALVVAVRTPMVTITTH